MALAPGGRMRQEIYDDTFALADWDTDHGSRCFLHLANSQTWRAITGEDPPTVPLTAGEYQKAGIPWFDFYTDASAVPGSSVLDGLDSIAEFAKSKGDAPPPANDSVVVEKVVLLRKGLRKDQVREGRF